MKSDLYTRAYFQGDRANSNYGNYIKDARLPSLLLADTLAGFFRPQTALDVGCAVGYTVKGLRKRGVKARGIDISTWAVRQAWSWHVRRLDFSVSPIRDRYDLVYSYDVIEHVMPQHLDYAIRNLWQATRRHLLIVPAVYDHGETHDPGEPTHLIFKSYAEWRRAFEVAGCVFDHRATAAFRLVEHTQLYGYADRVMVFSKTKP